MASNDVEDVCGALQQAQPYGDGLAVERRLLQQRLSSLAHSAATDMASLCKSGDLGTVQDKVAKYEALAKGGGEAWGSAGMGRALEALKLHAENLLGEH